MDEVLYRPSWQKLRISCVQEFGAYRGFQTVNGTVDNLNRLNNYIQDATGNAAEYATLEAQSMRVSLDVEHSVRIYRVWNFIHAVVNGMRQLELAHMKQIIEYYNALEAMVNTHNVVEMANKWDWNVVFAELEQMWVVERVWFTRIYQDMNQRVIEKDEVSPLMLKFKGLMDEINAI